MELKQIIKCMVAHQEEICTRFTGEQWRQEVPRWKFEFAAANEFGEFLDEIQGQWCWWKPSNPIVQNKAIEEFIDVVAFDLSICLHDSSVFMINNVLDDSTDIVKLSNWTYGSTRGDALYNTRSAHFALLASCNTRSLMIAFIALIINGSEFLGITPDELYFHFLEKHAKNIKRIESGYMETGIKVGLE